MNPERHDSTSAVMDAILLGQLDRVSQLLDSGVEINLKDGKGWTAMHFAAAAGYRSTVELLLARGADVNSTTNKNESCLLLAVLSGHIDIVRVLVSAGADVNLKSIDGADPLHAASQLKYYDMMNIMLGRVAQVDTTVDEDSTPLVSKQAGPGEFLLGDVADMISVENKNGQFLLKYGFAMLKMLMHPFLPAESDVSSQYNAIDTLNEFLKGTEIDIKYNIYGAIPLFCVLLSRYYNAVVQDVMRGKGYIISEYIADNPEADVISILQRSCAYTPLLKAGERDVIIVKLLLDNGAVLESRDTRDFTPLISAADRGHARLVKLLLDKGADVNLVAYRNESCLLRAAFRGHINVVRELVSAGADVNLQCNDGISPLHAAVKKGFIKVAKMLLENNNQHETDVNTADVRGDTPLHTAVHHGLDIVQLLVQHGAKMNVQNNWRETPLHKAVKRQQSDVIMFLLSQDAEVRIRDKYGVTLLHLAADH